MVSRSRVPNQGKLLDDYFPSRFLKAHDFFRWRVTEYLVTISRAVEEEVTPRPGEKEWKLVLYFSTKDGEVYPRGYLVSAKADVDVLRGMGVVAVRDLVGVRVLVCLDEWRGKSVLRLRPPREDKREVYEDAEEVA